MKRRVLLRITGRVQGVFFRMSASEAATRLGLSGLVRNEPDGSVTVDIEGGTDAVGKMIDWCGEGSDMATVEKIEVAEADPIGYDGFTIE